MKYYLLLLFGILVLHTHAQNPYYINYTIADGLPSDNVYSVSQDEDGLMWFTTDVGIVAYDSKTFKLFNTDDGLSDNEVFKLSRDHKGRMWMHTLNGKPCFIYNGKIYNEHNSDLLKKIKGAALVVNFYEDADGNIYISFRSGEVFVIDTLDSIKKWMGVSPHWGVWKTDIVYAAGRGAIRRLDNGGAIQVLNLHPNDKAANAQSRLCHLEDNQYFISGNSISVLRQNKFEPYLRIDNANGITNLHRIDNFLWVTTRNGVYQYRDTILVNHFFHNNAVSDFFRDREGNYWVSTLNRGVLMIPSMDVLSILDNKKIHCLGLNGQELWVGGVENDYYIKNKTSLIAHHLPPEWISNKISCFRFYNGKTYIGAKSGVVISEAGRTQYFLVNVNDLLSSNGYMYVATTYTAKLRIDEVAANIVRPLISDRILSKRTNVLEADDKGNIWVGTNFGLYLYANEPEGFRFYNLGEQFEELAISIEDILFDTTQKILLVATASRGVLVLKDNKVVQIINTKNGLNNNAVTTIGKIANNTYLVGTNNGLNKVTYHDNVSIVNNYNFQVGVKNKRINDIELLNDTVYVATDNGVLYFNINILKPLDVHPICNITGIKTQNGLYTGGALKYSDNDISVSFNGISFKDKGNVEFFCRFAETDKVWNTTRESQVNYKDLSPGRYTFEVFCKNGLGNSSAVRRVSFEILPPFWQAPWFIVLCALAGVGAVYGFVRHRFKRLQVKNDAEKKIMQAKNDKVQLEKQMLELEQKALRMQMNPHFIFNALNTIKGYYSEGDDVKAGSYIAKFSKLLRMLLNTEGQNTTLDNEIEMLRLYVELTRIRYHEKFDYAIEVDKGLMPADTIMPSLLLQPIVENAIIHGLASKTEQGMLLVLFKKEGDDMICVVEDNGVGRVRAAALSSDKLHNSKATAIVTDRLKLFDEITSFEIIDLEENGMASGTRVIIKLPIKYTGF